jgi:predicted nucleic acid-binding protein
MRRLVVDANIAAKWYLLEADSGAAEMLFADELEFHAPNFLATEFANICWKHSVAGRTSMEAWRLASHQLKKSIPYWHSDGQLHDQALDLAIAHKHPIFDCIYLALAIQIDGVVVTADKQFCQQFEKTEYGGRVMALHSFVPRIHEDEIATNTPQ